MSSHFPNSSSNLHVNFQGKFFPKIRYLERCSDIGETVDPVNAHEYKIWTTKITEIEEEVRGYITVNNDYIIRKVNIFFIY